MEVVEEEEKKDEDILDHEEAIDEATEACDQTEETKAEENAQDDKKLCYHGE